MNSNLTSDEIIDCLENLRSINMNNFRFSGDNLSLAIDKSIDLIEDYKILKSDILHYGLKQCNYCNHFNMPDESNCHVCNKSL